MYCLKMKTITFAIKMKMKIAIALAMVCFFFLMFFVIVVNRVNYFQQRKKQEHLTMIINGLPGVVLSEPHPVFAVGTWLSDSINSKRKEKTKQKQGKQN